MYASVSSDLKALYKSAIIIIIIITSDKGGGKCVCPRLSDSKITQKRVHGFG